MNHILALFFLLGSAIPLHAAGELVPVAAPAPTMRSLDEIYEAAAAATAATSPNQTQPLPDTALARGSDFIHMTVVGANQGEIAGSCTVAGREGSIVVDSISHNVLIPMDPSTGLATGTRQHDPIQVTLRIDQATPLLFAALVNGEALTSVRLQFWATSLSGQPVQYFTIQLNDARVFGIHLGDRDQIKLTLAYEAIVWTWTDQNISASDTWHPTRM